MIVLHGWAAPGTVAAALVARLAFEFQQRGYVTLALSMRGWPGTGGIDDCAGQQPDDIVAAVHWLAAQPYVDAKRIALVGYSQGGQVALLAAARGAAVKAVVAYAAPSDITAWAKQIEHEGIKTYIKTTCIRGAGARWRSPLYQAQLFSVPILLVHGDRDQRVPYSQSTKLFNTLRRAGKDAELLTVRGAGHVLEDISMIKEVDSFLTTHIRKNTD